MSLLDNSADLANAGTIWVMLKPFDERQQGQGPGPALDLPGSCRKRSPRCPTAGPSCCRRRPIQGIGNAGGFQMQLELLGGSFDYAELSNLANQIVKAAATEPALQNVLTTFRSGCAACHADGGP